MARFKYSGRDRKGKKSGVINASSKRDAMQKLKQEGIRVVEITEVKETFLTKDLSIGSGVKFQHIVIFFKTVLHFVKSRDFCCRCNKDSC